MFVIVKTCLMLESGIFEKSRDETVSPSVVSNAEKRTKIRCRKAIGDNSEVMRNCKKGSAIA